MLPVGVEHADHERTEARGYIAIATFDSGEALQPLEGGDIEA
jgi:hypothetical protein